MMYILRRIGDNMRDVTRPEAFGLCCEGLRDLIGRDFEGLVIDISHTYSQDAQVHIQHSDGNNVGISFMVNDEEHEFYTLPTHIINDLFDEHGVTTLFVTLYDLDLELITKS